MAILVDAFAAFVLLLGAYAEVRRELFLALTDILRIVLALIAGFVAYSIGHRLSGSYTVGLADRRYGRDRIPTWVYINRGVRTGPSCGVRPLPALMNRRTPLRCHRASGMGRVVVIDEYRLDARPRLG